MPEKREADLWELTDLCTPWCVHVAATLKIAEHISGGAQQIDALAKAASSDPDILHAVLSHLARKGVFEESSPGHFAMNKAAEPLLNPIVRSSLDLEDIGGRFAHAWSTLLHFTRTGESAYADLFGRPFFDDLRANPSLADSFDAIIGPPGHGAPNPEFNITDGWESIHTIMDVGGGTGALLAEILRLYPHIRGILVDLPDTVARSSEVFQAAGVSTRAQVVGQSFFDPLPASADLYLLRGILNNWPDRDAQAILRRCAEAARASAGRVVILKSIHPDGSPKDLSIDMVLVGGKQRNLAEFQNMAREVGLEVVSYGEQPLRDGMNGGYVVECRPVG